MTSPSPSRSSCDPRQRLGPDLFIYVISQLHSASDITAAEAVHSAWRDAILDRDRTLWLPEARRLGVKEHTLASNTEQKVRAICRARCITLDNRKDGRSIVRNYQAGSEEEDGGPWRVKVDDNARVAYVTGRSNSFRLLSIDLETDKVLHATSLGSGPPNHAHLEAANGYLMVTTGSSAVAKFQLLRTSTAVQYEQQQGVRIEPTDIERGKVVMHHLIQPPSPCNASRMRSVAGSGPVLCTAGPEGAYFWDVQSGTLLSNVIYDRSIVGFQVFYIEFNAEFLFILSNDPQILVFDRSTSQPTVVRLLPRRTKLYPYECTIITGASVSHIVQGTSPWNAAEPGSYIVPMCIHDSEDELVIICRCGWIVVVTAYKALFQELASRPVPSLLTQEGVYCIRTNLNLAILHVEPEYGLIHATTGVYSLSLQPFRDGLRNFHHLRLLYSDLDSSNLLGEHPSALQSTDDAVFFVHSLPTHRFGLCKLDFSPRPSQIP